MRSITDQAIVPARSGQKRQRPESKRYGTADDVECKKYRSQDPPRVQPRSELAPQRLPVGTDLVVHVPGEGAGAFATPRPNTEG